MDVLDQMRQSGIDEEGVEFFRLFFSFPKDLQDLYRLMMCGSPEQQLRAEYEIYDYLDAHGKDTTALREAMAKRLEDEAKRTTEDK